MQNKIQITSNSILALSNTSYVTNTLTQELEEPDFVGIDNISLNFKYKNNVFSSNETETILNSPLSNYPIYYRTSQSDYILFEGVKEEVSIPINNILIGPSELVVSNGIIDAWKILSSIDASASALTGSWITYDFTEPITITRLILKGSGSFTLSGSLDNVNFAVLSGLNSTEELQSIIDGNMHTIELPGNYRYYRIIADTNSVIDDLRFFQDTGDILYIGNVVDVLIHGIELSINNNDILSDIEFGLSDGSYTTGILYFNDIILPASTRSIETKININLNTKIQKYTANIYKGLT